MLDITIELSETLTFVFEQDQWEYTFEVECPDEVTEKEWRDLANGKANLSIYQGNGRGCIRIEDNNLVFITGPSGRGAVSEFTVPINLVSSKLHAAIDKMSLQ